MNEPDCLSGLANIGCDEIVCLCVQKEREAHNYGFRISFCPVTWILVVLTLVPLLPIRLWLLSWADEIKIILTKHSIQLSMFLSLFLSFYYLSFYPLTFFFVRSNVIEYRTALECAQHKHKNLRNKKKNSLQKAKSHGYQTISDGSVVQSIEYNVA